MKKLITLLVLFSGTLCMAQAHGITLAWTPSVTPGVTTQMVFKGTVAGGENFATPLVTFSDNTTATVLDTTGTAGTTYFYVVESCVGTICSGPSNEASAVFPTVPAPPTGLTANPR